MGEPEAAQTSPPNPLDVRPRKKRFAWRKFLRAMHRDIGYFGVGLTLVYAVSGIAVNHIADWDPSFDNFSQSAQVDTAKLVGTDTQIVANALAALAIDGFPDDVFRVSHSRIDAIFAEHTVHIQTDTGVVIDEGRRARPILRDINWLHLNRGKEAWTLFADLYAGMLILLALSGLLLNRGKRGIMSWRIVYLVAGFAIPIGYLWASGGS